MRLLQHGMMPFGRHRHFSARNRRPKRIGGKGGRSEGHLSRFWRSATTTAIRCGQSYCARTKGKGAAPLTAALRNVLSRRTVLERAGPGPSWFGVGMGVRALLAPGPKASEERRFIFRKGTLNGQIDCLRSVGCARFNFQWQP